MSLDDTIAASWTAKAAEWHRQVGLDGDRNRRHNSDPVLWRLLGDVAGQDVLDAGCGTGYLARKLHLQGARVTAVDVAEGMVAHTRELLGDAVQARVDDASALATVPDASMDAVVSNYVLMDLEDLPGAARAMARVLRPGGRAIVVVLHPCFVNEDGPERLGDGTVRYAWRQPYLDPRHITEEWGHFTTPFHRFHRPLQDYIGAFLGAGLRLTALEEPAAEDREGMTEAEVEQARWTPFSVVMGWVKD